MKKTLIVIMAVSLLAIVILGLVTAWLLQSQFGRYDCDYFSQKEYAYDTGTLIIRHEQCKIVNDQLWLFYTLEVTNHGNDVLRWRLDDFKIAQESSIVMASYDSIADVAEWSVWEINATESYPLYTILHNQSQKVTIVNPGFVDVANEDITS